MKTPKRPTALSSSLLAVGGICLLAAAVSCSRDMTSASQNGSTASHVPVTVSLAALAVAPGTPLADMGDSAGSMGGDADEFGRVRLSQIDSLIVTVTKVEVRVPAPDNGGEDKADSAEAKADSAEAKADTAHRGDDQGEDEHENDEVGWDSLGVTGGGHLNLVKLPDSAKAGIQVASGTLPPGTYRHVRIFVTGPMIFFNAPIITPTGDTLKAGVGYPVKIPSADSTGAAIKTDESFTVPMGGGTVPLFFDPGDTIRHVRVTGDGKIIIPPTIR